MSHHPCRLLPGWLLLAVCTLAGAQESVSGPSSLTVEAAVHVALERHPLLLAAAHQVSAAQSGLRAAGARPNPEIVLAPTLIGEQGTPEAINIRQALELGGSRKARLRIASAQSQAAEAEREVTRRSVALGVTEAYWEVVLARAVVELDRQGVEHAVSLAQAATTQVNLGNQPRMHQIKAELEVARANQQLLVSRADETRAMAGLCAAMGLPPDSRFTPAEPLAFRPAVLDDAGLMQSALSLRPELLTAASTVEAAEGEVDAVEAARRPDAALTYWQGAFDGEGGIGVSVSLPVFDWGGQGHEEDKARSEVAARRQLLLDAQNAIRLEVHQALIAVRSAEAQVLELQRRVIQQSEQLAEIARVGYEEGALSFLEVLEARRTLRTVLFEYDTAIARHLQAVGALQWASCVQVPLSAPDPAAPQPNALPAPTAPWTAPPPTPPAEPAVLTPTSGEVGVVILRRLPATTPSVQAGPLAEVTPR